MVLSEEYLNKYVTSIAPFSPPPIQKTALFCTFSLSNFASSFPAGATDPICPYVRTPVPATACNFNIKELSTVVPNVQIDKQHVSSVIKPRRQHGN